MRIFIQGIVFLIAFGLFVLTDHGLIHSLLGSTVFILIISSEGFNSFCKSISGSK